MVFVRYANCQIDLRGVTKFEFEFDNVRTSNVLADSKFVARFKRLFIECEFVEKSLLYD